jgi:hypothetical protein
MLRYGLARVDFQPDPRLFPLVPCVCLGKGVCFARSAFLSTAAPRRGTLPDLEQQPSPKSFSCSGTRPPCAHSSSVRSRCPVQLPAAHRFLAARVIDQAVRDVRNPNGAAIDSASARAFLSGSSMLSYWCEIAELDLNCVIDRARTLMAGCDAGRRGRPGSAEVRGDPQGAEICHPHSGPH